MAVDYSKLRSLASGVPVAEPITLTPQDDSDVSGSGADAVIVNNRTRIDEIEGVLVDLGVLTESGTGSS